MRNLKSDVSNFAYFLEYKDDPSRCTGWDEQKDAAIEAVPILGMYLKMEKELAALKEAALRSMRDFAGEDYE